VTLTLAEANSIVDAAVAKAWQLNVHGTGLPSGDVKGTVHHAPAAGVVGQGVPAVRIQGGLPIFRNGQIEGACGVGGAPSHEQEEECARAGIASILR
jgi:uncharacterized protein GlcG (DUF336 family)